MFEMFVFVALLVVFMALLAFFLVILFGLVAEILRELRWARYDAIGREQLSAAIGDDLPDSDFEVKRRPSGADCPRCGELTIEVVTDYGVDSQCDVCEESFDKGLPHNAQ